VQLIKQKDVKVMNVIRNQAVAMFDISIREKSLYTQQVDNCDTTCAISCYTDNYGKENSFIVEQCVIPNCGRSCASSYNLQGESLVSLNDVSFSNAENELTRLHNKRLIQESRVDQA
jgi:hypothetical protein